MADPLTEARLVGSIDQHEQITVNNSTGAELAPNEVFAITNDSGNTIPMVARETIADGSDGQASIIGEFSVAKNSTSVFASGDDVYWHTSANEAVERSEAKTGDFFLGRCTKKAVSGDSFVFVRLDDGLSADVISVSTSISVSVSNSSISSESTSSSSTSTSSSSISVDATSVSSLSNSSSASVSKSSNSDSSSSVSNSISSNSDSSTSSSSTSS